MTQFRMAKGWVRHFSRENIQGREHTEEEAGPPKSRASASQHDGEMPLSPRLGT